eukprot:11714185-Ditylum_brightwellii.AAC.1
MNDQFETHTYVLCAKLQPFHTHTPHLLHDNSSYIILGICLSISDCPEVSWAVIAPQWLSDSWA